MFSGQINLYAGWLGMLGGVLSGSLIGLRFHRPDWLGGYDAFPRRMVRLGHISFFGIGMLNVLFGLTVSQTQLRPGPLHVASIGFIVGAVLMPATCFLTAWRERLRHLFVLPVAAVSIAIIALLIAWT
jgi:hypothetical protein